MAGREDSGHWERLHRCGELGLALGAAADAELGAGFGCSLEATATAFAAGRYVWRVPGVAGLA